MIIYSRKEVFFLFEMSIQSVDHPTEIVKLHRMNTRYIKDYICFNDFL